MASVDSIQLEINTALVDECNRLRAEVDRLHTAHQQELERHRTTWTQLEQARSERGALRLALREIFNHVEGNTEELVRELVNWGTPRVNPNDFYEECAAIKAIICAAMQEASHENAQ